MPRDVHATVVAELLLGERRSAAPGPPIWRSPDGRLVGLVTAPRTLTLFEALPTFPATGSRTVPHEIIAGAIGTDGAIILATHDAVELRDSSDSLVARRAFAGVRDVAFDAGVVWVGTETPDAHVLHRLDLEMLSCVSTELEGLPEGAHAIHRGDDEIVVEIACGQDETVIHFVRASDLTVRSVHAEDPRRLVPGTMSADRYLTLSECSVEWRSRADGRVLRVSALADAERHSFGAALVGQHVVVALCCDPDCGAAHASLLAHERDTLGRLGAAALHDDWRWSPHDIASLGSEHVLLVEGRLEGDRESMRARVISLSVGAPEPAAV